MFDTRKAAVAGSFYPDSASKLHDLITNLLEKAQLYDKYATPKVIISPHAGYVYSGSIAASAFKPLEKISNEIKKVILVGPSHNVYFEGLSIPSKKYFQTPLGKTKIDQEQIKQLLELDYITKSDKPHCKEHSIEVQLPFLQEILDDFTITPIVVGDAGAKQVSNALELLWGGPETLIIISSDLSHFHNYEEANQIDKNTSDSIIHYDTQEIYSETACGCKAINGMLLTAKKLGLKGSIIDIKNSGDTSSNKEQVVGYGAYHFGDHYMNDIEYSDEQRTHLLTIAREAIAYGLDNGKPLMDFTCPEDLFTHIPTASFVTLHQNGQLRGCIGSLEAYTDLTKDVSINAFNAAFKDSRFENVIKEDLEKISISISILTPATKMAFESESDLLNQLKPGIDGLILKDGKKNQATFLPTVWQELPTSEEFLNHLKIKAGLLDDYWSNSIEIYRYKTILIEE